MPELTPRSALGSSKPTQTPADHAEFSMVLREGLALANVLVRQGCEQEFRARVSTTFGIDLPNRSRRVEIGSISFARAGPDHWLASTEGAQGHTFEASLRHELNGLAYISDQSDGRTIIRISGPRARAVLAKGVPIDLHPLVFKPGDTAVTTIAHIGAHLWQIDEAPTYEVAVFRSYSAAFWRWLGQASAEFRF